MTKDELLKHVQESIKTEESATAIYMKHLSAIILRSGLDNAETQRIRQVIEFLIKENEYHKRLLINLADRIKGESLNVY